MALNRTKTGLCLCGKEGSIGSLQRAFVLRAVLDTFVAIDTLLQWGIGWRYAFSRSFRAKVHARWRERRRRAVVSEVIGHFILFAFVNGVLVLFAAMTLLWLYRGIVVPRLTP
jgi:hypothetical protein